MKEDNVKQNNTYILSLSNINIERIDDIEPVLVNKKKLQNIPFFYKYKTSILF